jgi:hypothetical protein
VIRCRGRIGGVLLSAYAQFACRMPQHRHMDLDFFSNIFNILPIAHNLISASSLLKEQTLMLRRTMVTFGLF